MCEERTTENDEPIITAICDEPIEIEIPTSLKNKLNAIDLMNKMQGEYVQKVEAEVTNAVNINIELSED
jgi:hypothetical protein